MSLRRPTRMAPTSTGGFSRAAEAPSPAIFLSAMEAREPVRSAAGAISLTIGAATRIFAASSKAGNQSPTRGGRSMTLPRRMFLSLAAGAAALPAAARVAWSQGYPSRPVRIVVGFPAGGATDIQARLMGQWLSERLGQQFIIENRAGASGNIGTEAVAKAPADGYTLLQIVTPNAINAALYSNLNFDFSRDIVPIVCSARLAYVVVVHPSLPITTIPELIAYAKANPGKINYGSAGSGTPQNISAELFKMMAGVNLVHVPYRGGAPATTDLVGGHKQAIFSPVSESIEHIKAGKLRPLAVTTTSRLDVLPDVPTVADFVPGYE